MLKCVLYRKLRLAYEEGSSREVCVCVAPLGCLQEVLDNHSIELIARSDVKYASGLTQVAVTDFFSHRQSVQYEMSLFPAALALHSLPHAQSQQCNSIPAAPTTTKWHFPSALKHYIASSPR